MIRVRTTDNGIEVYDESIQSAALVDEDVDVVDVITEKNDIGLGGELLEDVIDIFSPNMSAVSKIYRGNANDMALMIYPTRVVIAELPTVISNLVFDGLFHRIFDFDPDDAACTYVSGYRWINGQDNIDIDGYYVDVGYGTESEYSNFTPTTIDFNLPEGYTHWSDFSTGTKRLVGSIAKNTNFNICSKLLELNGLQTPTIRFTDASGFISFLKVKDVSWYIDEDDRGYYIYKICTDRSISLMPIDPSLIYIDPNLIFTYDSTKFIISSSSRTSYSGGDIHKGDYKRDTSGYVIRMNTSQLHETLKIDVSDNPFCEADTVTITVETDYTHLAVDSKLSATNVTTNWYAHILISRVGNYLTFGYNASSNSPDYRSLYYINASLTTGKLVISGGLLIRSYSYLYSFNLATNNDSYSIIAKSPSYDNYLDNSCLTINSSLTMSNLSNVLIPSSEQSSIQAKEPNVLFAEKVGVYALFIVKYMYYRNNWQYRISMVAINNSLSITRSTLYDLQDRAQWCTCKSISFNNEAWMFYFPNLASSGNTVPLTSFRVNNQLVKTDNTFLQGIYEAGRYDSTLRPSRTDVYVVGKSASKLFIASRSLDSIHVVNTSYTVSLLPYAVYPANFDVSKAEYVNSMGALNGKCIWAALYARNQNGICAYVCLDDSLTLTYDTLSDVINDNYDTNMAPCDPDSVIGNYAIINGKAISTAS